MLEHSLQDEPSDISRDNNSRIAYLYNRNEAENFVWAYFLESKNVLGYISGALAQGGSIIPPMANMNGLPRLDEERDRKARWAGVKYNYDRNNQWWIYYALYGGRIK